MSHSNSAVYLAGQKHNQAIVFLHSSLSSAKQWLPLMHHLSDNYFCIAIDLLGYGEAEPVVEPSQYNFNLELQRIREIVANTIADKPFHLVGHSCGGAIALKWAVESPQAIISLCLYEPVAFHLLPSGSDERKIIDDFSQQVANKPNIEAAELFTDFWNFTGFFRQLPKKIQEQMAKSIAKVNLDFIGLTSERYHLEDLNKLTFSSQIIVGRQSPKVSQNLALAISKALSNCRLTQVEAGHMGPIAQPGVSLPPFIDFINQQ
ncbi:alpha/beta fold hydrolase [Thalassotalea ganghwensis]